MANQQGIVIVVAAVLAIWGISMLGKKGEEDPAPDPTGPPTGTDPLEVHRAFYEADLRARGWTGSLAGNTAQQIYQNYLIAFLETERQRFMDSLADRGCRFFVEGSTVEELFINYQNLLALCEDTPPGF